MRWSGAAWATRSSEVAARANGTLEVRPRRRLAFSDPIHREHRATSIPFGHDPAAGEASGSMTVRAVFTVDFEGIHGMDHPAPHYDLDTTTLHLLGALRRRSIRGVFFVVGQLVKEQPGLIEVIARDGHEVAVHGVDHSCLQPVGPVELDCFADDLAQICDRIAEIVRVPTAGVSCSVLDESTLLRCGRLPMPRRP